MYLLECKNSVLSKKFPAFVENYPINREGSDSDRMTIVDLLRSRAFHQSSQIAYSFLGDGENKTEELTYGQLYAQSTALSIHLEKMGMKGRCAVLMYPPGLEFIVAFFGCLRAGVIAVPACPPRPNQSLFRLQSIISDSQAAIALTTSSLLSILDGKLTEKIKSDSFPFLETDILDLTLSAQGHSHQVSRESLAFLQYTSGSTGSPKGVMVSHGNLLCNLMDIDKGFLHTPNSALVSWLPTFHDMGLIYGILQPLFKGFPCYLMAPVHFLQRPMRWLEAISRYRATHSAAPNFAYDLCARKISPEQREALDLSSWRMALNGAEVVRADVLQRFADTFESCGFRMSTFCPGYGLAEATLKVAAVKTSDLPVFYRVQTDALKQNQVVESYDSQIPTQTLVGCGHPEIDTKIVIVDPDSLTRCAPDRVGEIWVSGLTVAQGYWQRPQETEATFNAYLADSPEGPFLRTGDLGFLREDGELFVTGRLKDVIIVRGRNHYPQDIELTVKQSHPALEGGCGAAFSIEVAGEEKLVIAQEIGRTYLRRLDFGEILANLRQSLVREHGLPFHAIALLKPGQIPKTSSGKIQRRACRDKFLAGTLPILIASPDAHNPQKHHSLHPSVSPKSVRMQGRDERKFQTVPG